MSALLEADLTEAMLRPLKLFVYPEVMGLVTLVGIRSLIIMVRVEVSHNVWAELAIRPCSACRTGAKYWCAMASFAVRRS